MARQMAAGMTAHLEKELAYARLKNQVLEARLGQLLIDRYRKASEKLSDLQLNLLEAEPGVSSEEVQAESEREPIASSSERSSEESNTESEPKRKRGGRQSLPAHLLRVEKIIACPAEQCTCSKCGEATAVIGYEENEVLDVKVIKREKRSCKGCERHGVSVAPVPERIIPKSMVSDQIVIDTIVAKYSDSLPLYRQSVMLKRDTGIDISRSTLDSWVM
jgi:transposase